MSILRIQSRKVSPDSTDALLVSFYIKLHDHPFLPSSHHRVSLLPTLPDIRKEQHQREQKWKATGRDQIKKNTNFDMARSLFGGGGAAPAPASESDDDEDAVEEVVEEVERLAVNDDEEEYEEEEYEEDDESEEGED